MVPSHILVRALLTISGLRCWTREYSRAAIAFRASPLRASRGAAKRPAVSASLGGADGEGETPPYHLLLDESVLLYSQVARQASSESDKEIEALRKHELTLLVEDTVFDERGVRSADSEEENDQIIMEIGRVEKKPETLDEISQALDQQILLGYEAEFTEEQLEQWVGQIDALYEKLQSQAAALPPASSLVDTSTSKETEAAIETTATATAAATATTPFDKLLSRLESMRTLIDPAGNGRWQPPLARSVVESVTSLPPTPTPSPPAVVETETKTLDETTGIETPLKTSLPSDTSSKIENDTTDPMDEPTNEHVETVASSPQQTPTASSSPAVVETETKTPDESTGTETPLKTSLPSDTSSKIENNTTDPMDEPTNEQNPTPNTTSASTSEPDGNKWVEVAVDADRFGNAATRGKALDGNETSASANVTAGIGNANGDGDGDGDADADAPDQQPLTHPAKSTELDGTDIVSTVVTTAAIGAAAVTKMPLFVAGVALGPVIRDSIAYAKGRMANNTKTTSIGIDGNSTSGEDVDVDVDSDESDVVEGNAKTTSIEIDGNSTSGEDVDVDVDSDESDVSEGNAKTTSIEIDGNSTSGEDVDVDVDSNESDVSEGNAKTTSIEIDGNSTSGEDVDAKESDGVEDGADEN